MVTAQNVEHHSKRKNHFGEKKAHKLTNKDNPNTHNDNVVASIPPIVNSMPISIPLDDSQCPSLHDSKMEISVGIDLMELEAWEQAVLNSML